MVVHEMTEQECRAMLARTSIARLACARNGQPYIVPIHVDFDGECLYSFATQGLKIDWMRQNPLVCLEIDELSLPMHWASVVVFGRYEELPDLPEYEDWRRVALQLFQRHPMWWQPATLPVAGHEQRASVVFRIRIDRVTGRRGSDDDAVKAHVHENPSDASRPSWLARVVRRGVAAVKAWDRSVVSERVKCVQIHRVQERKHVEVRRDRNAAAGTARSTPAAGFEDPGGSQVDA